MEPDVERSKREAARGRIMAVVQAALDRHIPLDTRRGVKDGTFWEWEDLADAFDREVTPVFLEELAKLSGQADLAVPGPCPFCESSNTKWLNDQAQRERRSKHGVVVVPRQNARCRSCGRSFSPAGDRLGLGSARATDPAGPGPHQPGGGPGAL